MIPEKSAPLTEQRAMTTLSRMHAICVGTGRVCMHIFVGNLSREVTEKDLRQAFEAFGSVKSTIIVKDKFTGHSRGFGFVEMPAPSGARSAIDGLNGQDLKGRALIVDKAQPRPEDPRARPI